MRESSLWRALGDPARRALVDLRLVEPAPVRVLARVPDHTTSRLEAPPCCASPVWWRSTDSAANAGASFGRAVVQFKRL